MMPRLRTLRVALIAILIFAATFARAADLLDEVPNDALGFIHVHHLRQIESKSQKLTSEISRTVFSPLNFLHQVAGLKDGLNLEGDCLFVVLPDANGNDRKFEYCVWIPVTDYDGFLHSLNARSVDGIASATIGGEDLLVAHRGEWALVMDPDQRPRIAELAAATPSPPPMPDWKPWINSNDVSVIAFAPGLRYFSAWLDNDSDNERSGSSSQDKDNPFGYLNENSGDEFVAANANRGTADSMQGIKIECRKWLAAAPEMAQAIQQVTAAGCGLRLDDKGSAIAGMRVAISKEFTDEYLDKKNTGAVPAAFSAYDGGGFALNGAGHIPTALLAAISSAYVRRTAADLVAEEKTELDEDSLKLLQEEVEKAAADVQSVALLSQPGLNPQPVYTNNFVVVRVGSTSTFVDHAKEVMRLWNKANRDAKGEIHMVFDEEETKIGERTAEQYSLDVAALDGTAVVPEVRQAMERLFGAGGKLRVWVIPTDDHTMLLAAATPEQVATAIKSLDRKQPTDWQSDEFAATNALLPTDADWRIFVDPGRYEDWVRREAIAMAGVPIIGGRVGRDFASTTPVGIAGSMRDGELWLDAAALSPTFKSLAVYFLRSRAPNAVQLQVHVEARQAPAPRPNRVKPN
ncbi:MAG TPA: hypothetical protein VHU84_08515 [Lacipirellulaceae bacterium]|nr:hypothetical protein [Lacipirellulaceae bacterium]